jgi:hypothetical protein
VVEIALDGSCHCGALSVRFLTMKYLADLPLLACECSFCCKCDARVTADPQGALCLTLRVPEALIRYECGLRTAHHLICQCCGVYVCTVGINDREEDGVIKERGVVNVKCLADQTAFERPATPIDYDGESRETRLARQRQTWTPVRWN